MGGLVFMRMRPLTRNILLFALCIVIAVLFLFFKKI
jgi:hypothetical protein